MSSIMLSTYYVYSFNDILPTNISLQYIYIISSSFRQYLWNYGGFTKQSFCIS